MSKNKNKSAKVVAEPVEIKEVSELQDTHDLTVSEIPEITKKKSKKASAQKVSKDSEVEDTIVIDEESEVIVTDNASLVDMESIKAEDAPIKSSPKKKKALKTKVIRDSFSFPEDDYLKISELKKTCLDAGVHVKKSEVLRAGLHLLSAMSLEELKAAIEVVEKVPTGRPSSH